MYIAYFKKPSSSWTGFLSWGNQTVQLLKSWEYKKLIDLIPKPRENTSTAPFDKFAHAKNQVNLDLVLDFIFEQMVLNYQLVGKEIGMLSLTFILPLATEAWSIS